MRITYLRNIAIGSLISLASLASADEPPVRVAKVPAPVLSKSQEKAFRSSHRTPLDEYREKMRLHFASQHPGNIPAPNLSSSTRASNPIPHRNFTQRPADVVTASHVEHTVSPRPMSVERASDRVTYNSHEVQAPSHSDTGSCTETCSSTQSEPLATFDTGPTGFSYYFRPYQYSDIAKHQNETFVQDRKNPYDNRFFESIYSR